MAAVRRSLRGLGGSDAALVAAAATAAVAALALFGERRFGAPGLALPLVVGAALVLFRRPVAAVAVAVALPVLAEGESFGVGPMTALYTDLIRGLTPLDGLVLFALASVAFDVVRTGRGLRLPAALGLPLGLTALALAAGVVVTQASGASTTDIFVNGRIVAYLIALPFAIVNLDLSATTVTRLLHGAVALAIAKAVIGLLALGAGISIEIEAGTSLTYYEPTANWLILVALLGVLGALLTGARPPLWMLLGTPLMVACLVLSYRRSFWIAAIVGLLLLLLLALATPRGRRVVVPAVALVAVAIWVLGTLDFQAQTPLVKRVESLNPAQLETNAQDRYRIDERVNVVAEIRDHPIAGLGLVEGWSAAARPLPVEHVDGREYVHFALLWWWLKLGLLGAAAYVAIAAAFVTLAWRTFRRDASATLRCFGLASLCSVAGLLVIETTATFLGVDARFSVLYAAQLGMLAVAAGIARPPDAAAARPGRDEPRESLPLSG
ncbi:MAG: hypothetical protein GXY03_15295 [Solirubrobacterales bacterium]|nr:hypothetical protein [Solirubrobacterales bacterium]